MSRKMSDHRYNTSPKGKSRRRRYDQKLSIRLVRRDRDLRRRRVALTTELDSVRKELETIGR